MRFLKRQETPMKPLKKCLSDLSSSRRKLLQCFQTLFRSITAKCFLLSCSHLNRSLCSYIVTFVNNCICWQKWCWYLWGHQTHFSALTYSIYPIRYKWSPCFETMRILPAFDILKMYVRVGSQLSHVHLSASAKRWGPRPPYQNFT